MAFPILAVLGALTATAAVQSSLTGVEFEKKLKEYVGHTPLQVLMGAILGLFIAILMGSVYGYIMI